jgi:hypothetical protein
MAALFVASGIGHKVKKCPIARGPDGLHLLAFRASLSALCQHLIGLHAKHHQPVLWIGHLLGHGSRLFRARPEILGIIDGKALSSHRRNESAALANLLAIVEEAWLRRDRIGT